jgi:hypothetical protein
MNCFLVQFTGEDRPCTFSSRQLSHGDSRERRRGSVAQTPQMIGLCESYNRGLSSPRSSRQGRAHATAVAAGILLSRLAGLIRDGVFAHYFGNSDAADAFRATFRIPNFLQNLFGEGVLSASFIPVCRTERKAWLRRNGASLDLWWHPIVDPLGYYYPPFPLLERCAES